MTTIETETIGDAWLETARRILRDGTEAVYDGEPTKELALVAIHVAAPDPDDATIARLADPDWLDWMRRNFTEPDDVPELGGARSYARRLRDYGGRDQVAWVIERLADPECRSAAITTFEPHTDTTYVPCISLLDFWRVSGPLELVVYAHSLDFGKKAYGNLVELARLQHEVAGAVGCPVGSLVVHAKSAHVYEPELALDGGALRMTVRDPARRRPTTSTGSSSCSTARRRSRSWAAAGRSTAKGLPPRWSGREREPERFGRLIVEVDGERAGVMGFEERSDSAPHRPARRPRDPSGLPRPAGGRRGGAPPPALPARRARLSPARARVLRLQRARDPPRGARRLRAGGRPAPRVHAARRVAGRSAVFTPAGRPTIGP